MPSWRCSGCSVSGSRHRGDRSDRRRGRSARALGDLTSTPSGAISHRSTGSRDRSPQRIDEIASPPTSPRCARTSRPRARGQDARPRSTERHAVDRVEHRPALAARAATTGRERVQGRTCDAPRSTNRPTAGPASAPPDSIKKRLARHRDRARASGDRRCSDSQLRPGALRPREIADERRRRRRRAERVDLTAAVEVPSS